MLRESSKDGEPDLILIATGSEVHICTEAADLLEADGIATRVVSVPCLERFAEQDDDYRDERAAAERARARVGRGRQPRSAGTAGSATTATRSG